MRRCNVCHDIADYSLYETVLDKDQCQRDILVCPSCNVLYNETLEQQNFTSSEIENFQRAAVQGVYHISDDELARIGTRVAESEPIISFLFEQNEIPLNRGTYLEVGAGAGYLAAAAARSFTNIFTIELDSREIKKTFDAMNVASAKVMSNINEFSRVGASADLIVLWHTLEHIQNPLEFLKDLKRALSRTGVIYFQVPLYRRQNVFPAHIWFFNARTIGVLRERLGFNKQKIVFDTTNDFMTVMYW